MDQLDDTTVMIAALCATAAAGALVFVNVQSCQRPREEKKAAKKKRSRRRKKKTNVDDSSVGWTPPVHSPKDEDSKKKKKLKKKKKQKEQQEKKKEQIRKESNENLSSFIDDGSDADSWSLVRSKKTRKSKETNDDVVVETKQQNLSSPKKKRVQTSKKIIDVGKNTNAVIGKGGRTIRNIEESTGCRLNIDKQTNILTISADTSDKVDAAEKMVLETISKNQKSSIESNSAVVIKLDLGDKAGAVIGRGGSTIREIEESSGASLDIDKDRSQGRATLTIRASTQDSADVAKRMVTDILKKEEQTEEQTEDRVQVTMDLESRHVVMSVIGRGGFKIREMELKSGARLSVKRDTTVLEISGTEDQVKAAKALVQEVVSSVSGSRLEVKLTRETVGSVIGRGGSTIREIQQKSGARLQIVRDNRNSEDVSVHITGSSNAVETAKNLVDKAISSPPKKKGVALGPGEVEVSIELGRAVGSVIGKGGSNVIRIENETGAKINVERGSTTCQIYGEAVAVAKAKDEVDAIVQRVKENDKKREAAKSQRQQDILASTGQVPASPKKEDFSTTTKNENLDEQQSKDSSSGWGADAQGW